VVCGGGGWGGGGGRLCLWALAGAKCGLVVVLSPVKGRVVFVSFGHRGAAGVFWWLDDY